MSWRSGLYLFLGLYLALWVWDAGATYAHFNTLYACQGPRVRRENAVFSIMWSGLPSAPFLTIAFTGAYEDGWQLPGSKINCGTE